MVNTTMVVSYCSGSAPGSRHISHLIRNSWRQTTRYVKQIFSLRTSSCIPEDTPSEKSTTMMILILPRNLLPLLPKASPLQDQSFPSRARRPHHPTSFISTYIHGVPYVARSSHVSTLQQLLLQRRLLHKVAEITLAIKDIMQAVMKESQHADHAVIEIRMTCTANEDSPGIYTLGDRRR